MSKKKVLIVTDYFYPHWTGIAKSIFNTVQMLEKYFDFTVLTVQHDKKLIKNEKLNSIQIIREPFIFTFSRVKYSLSVISTFLSIVPHTDVILINSPLSNILPISIITKLYRKKLLMFHQGDLILTKGINNRLIELGFNISTLISFFLADKVSTYTTDYANYSRVLKPFMKKFTPLIPPINNKSLNGNAQTANQKIITKLRKLRLKNNVIFGFGGRFVDEKGFDLLIKAIPLVIKRIPKVHFLFAGETKITYEKTFFKFQPEINKYKKNLTMLGLLNKKELFIFYKTIDYIVIPSRSDCFPLFQAEAMMFGKPSIVADIPGARYLVKESGFGLIFATENYNDLALKLALITKKKNYFNKYYPTLLNLLDNKKNAEIFRKYIEE